MTSSPSTTTPTTPRATRIVQLERWLTDRHSEQRRRLARELALGARHVDELPATIAAVGFRAGGEMREALGTDRVFFASRQLSDDELNTAAELCAREMMSADVAREWGKIANAVHVITIAKVREAIGATG